METAAAGIAEEPLELARVLNIPAPPDTSIARSTIRQHASTAWYLAVMTMLRRSNSTVVDPVDQSSAILSRCGPTGSSAEGHLRHGMLHFRVVGHPSAG